MMRRLWLTATGIAFLACGGGDSGGGTPAAGGGAAGAAVAPLGSGAISGTVMFQGTPAQNPAVDMSEEAACAAKHTGGVRDPQVVVTNGMLKNVFVRVTGGLPAGPYPMPAAAEVDQDGCLYMPRVLGVMVGQTLRIKNSDPLLHNIKAVPTANRPFNISQPREGMTTERTFSTPEVMVPLECNVHGWMQAYVGVVEHPYFAVSGDDGTFRITGLPPGTYQVEAWHEKFGTKTGEVTIAADGTGSVSFTYGPTT